MTGKAVVQLALKAVKMVSPKLSQIFYVQNLGVGVTEQNLKWP